MNYFLRLWFRIAVGVVIVLTLGIALDTVFGKIGVAVYVAVLVCGLFAVIGAQDELEEYFKTQRAETPVQRETKETE